jgi:hypothetical protein
VSSAREGGAAYASVDTSSARIAHAARRRMQRQAIKPVEGELGLAE